MKEDGARRTQAVKSLAARVPEGGMVIMMSGTPFVNRPKELIEPLLMLGYLSPDRLAPNSAEAFRWRFCARYRVKTVTTTNEDGEEKTSQRLITTFDGARNTDALAAWLRRRCMIRRRKAEVLPALGQKARRQVMVRISEDDYQRYEDMAAEAAAEVDHGAELVKLNLLRQFLGKAKVQQAVPWILDFCRSGKKLVVFADHIEVQNSILTSLQRNGITTAELLGDTGADSESACRSGGSSGTFSLRSCRVLNPLARWSTADRSFQWGAEHTTRVPPTFTMCSARNCPLATDWPCSERLRSDSSGGMPDLRAPTTRPTLP